MLLIHFSSGKLDQWMLAEMLVDLRGDSASLLLEVYYTPGRKVKSPGTTSTSSNQVSCPEVDQNKHQDSFQKVSY